MYFFSRESINNLYCSSVNGIVVFTTPTCGWCRKVKRYLKQNNLIYKEVDVSKDAYAMRVMVNKSGQMGVPQLWINNVAVVGFDKAKIDKLTK